MIRCVFVALLLSLTFGIGASAQGIYWQTVDRIFSREPAVVSGDVHRYGFPRTDLNVTLDGVTISRRWRSAAGSHSSRCMAES